MSKFPIRLISVVLLFYSVECSDPLKIRTGRIENLLQHYIRKEQIAGIVAYVLRDGEPYHISALGYQDKENNIKMQTNTIFRIASQTKAITSAAILMLVEEKKIRLHDPVSKFIPQFSQPKVSTTNLLGGNVRLVDAERPITIHHLLTHTSGLSYGMTNDIKELYRAQGLGPSAGPGWYLADKSEAVCHYMEKLGELPLNEHPGMKFIYGYSTDVLGCVIEKVSKVSLDVFFRTRIFQKLTMNDTHFFLPPDKANRLAVVYKSGRNKKYQLSPGQGAYINRKGKCFSGGAGLLSTAEDYAKFLEMIRNGGLHKETRILKEESVRLMTTNQAGTVYGGNGQGFGYGFMTTEKAGAFGLDSPGSFGWGGAYGTWYRVDPVRKVTMVLLFQLWPNETDIREKFSQAVYESMM